MSTAFDSNLYCGFHKYVKQAITAIFAGSVQATEGMDLEIFSRVFGVWWFFFMLRNAMGTWCLSCFRPKHFKLVVYVICDCEQAVYFYVKDENAIPTNSQTQMSKMGENKYFR